MNAAQLTPPIVANPGASARAIEHHYDVSLAFWRLWLGPTMAYSCALWAEGDDLAAAQNRKIDWHVEQSRAPGKARVLDVGCGWGSAVRRMVDVHGVKNVVGLTLSGEQARYVRDLALPGVEVRVESWSDHSPSAPYDAAISVGAFEHFAKPDQSTEAKIEGYRAFFRRSHEWLVPGAWLSLQTITYGDMPPERQSAFLKEEIYPESELPTLQEIAAASSGLFEVVSLRNDRLDYARTCREWLALLHANRAEAERLEGAATVARYVKYLKYSLVGFHVGNTYLTRWTLRRIDTRPG